MVWRIIGLTVGLALGHWIITQAQAADEATCARYGVSVERLVTIATGDADVAQMVRARAEAYCGVIDFPPIEISIDDAVGTAPASGASTADKPASAWEKKCAAGYKSFRASDGTVLRRGHRGRVKCPL